METDLVCDFLYPVKVEVTLVRHACQVLSSAGCPSASRLPCGLVALYDVLFEEALFCE
jgi:hypothetical protein